MQQLWPINQKVDPQEAYTHTRDGGFLRINMVSTLDGAIAIDGRSAGLSSEVDKKSFHAMRSLADVILVGASTARKENYRPIQFNNEVMTHRRTRAQSETLGFAVVTHSGVFDWNHPFFADADVKPIIYTVNSTAEKLAEHHDHADIVACGEVEVDCTLVKQDLTGRGLLHILCEGGPRLNASLLESDVVDELCLTINPLIVQGSGKRIFDGDTLDIPQEFDFTEIFLEESMMFLRCAKSATGNMKE